MELAKPPRLRAGDRVAAVTLSWGGPAVFPHRYEAGKRQLQAAFGIEVVEMPHTLADAATLADDPAARADDLHRAFTDPDIAGLGPHGHPPRPAACRHPFVLRPHDHGGVRREPGAARLPRRGGATDPVRTGGTVGVAAQPGGLDRRTPGLGRAVRRWHRVVALARRSRADARDQRGGTTTGPAHPVPAHPRTER
ncbi:MAG: LD-carboxypeptidase [Actinobacteria bacterium]|nr:LD-carboxypeptidase [Actinomycetota bacterium]